MGLVELTSLTKVDEIKVHYRLDSRVRDRLFDIVLLAQNLSAIVLYDDVAERIFLQNEGEINSRAVRLEEHHLDGVIVALEFAVGLKNVNEWGKNGSDAKLGEQILGAVDEAVTNEDQNQNDAADAKKAAIEKISKVFDFDDWRCRAKKIGNNLSVDCTIRSADPILCYYRKLSPTKSPFVKANYCSGVAYHPIELYTRMKFAFMSNSAASLSQLCRLIENDEKIYAKWIEKGKPKPSQEVIYAE